MSHVNDKQHKSNTVCVRDFSHTVMNTLMWRPELASCFWINGSEKWSCARHRHWNLRLLEMSLENTELSQDTCHTSHVRLVRSGPWTSWDQVCRDEVIDCVCLFQDEDSRSWSSVCSQSFGSIRHEDRTHRWDWTRLMISDVTVFIEVMLQLKSSDRTWGHSTVCMSDVKTLSADDLCQI